MKYFKVKYGFGKNDFLSIEEEDLVKAHIAMATGKLFVASNGEGTVAGNQIQAILPDYNRVMGFNPDYQLTGEDWKEIGTKVVHAHRQALQSAKLNALQMPGRTKELHAGTH